MVIKKHHYIIFILLCIYITILSPKLFSEGMFMDGLWYAVIGRNLSEGIGSFWHLKFTETVYKSFYEHPPLAFGLQSLFFTVLGDHFWVERMYSLLTFLVTTFILLRFWKEITRSSNAYYFPLIIFMTIPLVKWCTENNLLENTMSIFTLLSVFFQFKSLSSKRWINLFLASFFVLLAFLTKGFTGLFVLSFFFWYSLIDLKNWRLHLANLSYLLIFSIFLFSILILISPDAKYFLTTYFNKQVVGSISSISTVDSRLYILKRCLTEELLIPIIITVSVLTIKRKKLNEITKSVEFKLGSILILLAFSGVIPIMVSMKQRGFYIMATFPFFALGFALILYPFFKSLTIKKINTTLLKSLSVISLAAMLFIIIKSSKEVRRNQELVNDCKLICQKVKKGEIIGACSDLDSEYSLMGYLMRYNNISIDVHSQTSYPNYISTLNCEDDKIKKSLKGIPLKTFKYQLYQK